MGTHPLSPPLRTGTHVLRRFSSIHRHTYHHVCVSTSSPSPNPQYLALHPRFPLPGPRGPSRGWTVCAACRLPSSHKNRTPSHLRVRSQSRSVISLLPMRPLFEFRPAHRSTCPSRQQPNVTRRDQVRLALSYMSRAAVQTHAVPCLADPSRRSGARLGPTPSSPSVKTLAGAMLVCVSIANRPQSLAAAHLPV